MQTNNKLREALEDIGRIVEQIRLLYSDYPYETHLIARKVNAALAEPVKNCEVGTVEELYERYEKFCCSHFNNESDNCLKCPFSQPTCKFAWAKMPYVEKEGGAK